MPSRTRSLTPLLLLALAACSSEDSSPNEAMVQRFSELEVDLPSSEPAVAEVAGEEEGERSADLDGAEDQIITVSGGAAAAKGEAEKKAKLGTALAAGPVGSRSEGVEDISGLLGDAGLTGGLGSSPGMGGLGTRGTGQGGGGGIGSGVGYGAGSSSGMVGTKGRVAGNLSVGLQGAQSAPRGTTGVHLEAPAVPVASNTEGFVNYGVNDMTLSEKDRFSTFAADVDTASYAIGRRKLGSGMLPPQASVRVEEYVNAMEYGYRAPGAESDAPFAVHMEAAPSPFEDSHHVLRVAVQGMEVVDRQPVHLTFLVDTSGSMSSPDKLGLAQQALVELVEGLGPNDTVALATYAGNTRRVLGPTSASQGSTIGQAIQALTSGGGTAMSNGMELAYQMASESYVRGHENRVIVLSDGDANIGRTSHEQILRTVQHHAQEGITLTTVGFGMGNYQDVMMEQLANKGDGNYFYVDSQKEAQRVFGVDLAGTLVTIAKDLKIQVEFNPEAVIGYRLIGYENRDVADKDFRDDRVDAGEIGSGHAVTALYDLVLADSAEDMELATVRLRAKKPGPDSPASEWATVFSPGSLHAELADTSASFRMAIAVASFAELLRGSPYAAELHYSEVLALASGASLKGVAEHQELLGLIRVAAELSGDGSDSLVAR